MLIYGHFIVSCGEEQIIVLKVFSNYKKEQLKSSVSESTVDLFQFIAHRILTLPSLSIYQAVISSYNNQELFFLIKIIRIKRDSKIGIENNIADCTENYYYYC